MLIPVETEASKSGYQAAIMVASSLEFDGRKHDLKIHALLAVVVMISLVKHSWIRIPSQETHLGQQGQPLLAGPEIQKSYQLKQPRPRDLFFFDLDFCCGPFGP